MDTALFTAITNLGWGGVILALVLTGWLVARPTYRRALQEIARKDKVIDSLQEALALERQRSNDVTQAGTVTNQLISGLLQLATERRDRADGADGMSAGRALPPAVQGEHGKPAGL